MEITTLQALTLYIVSAPPTRPHVWQRKGMILR
jgi:hypothetical protein